MESTYQSGDPQVGRESLGDAREHFKDMVSASSRAEAWRSCKNMLEALPAWVYVVMVICAIALVTNGSILLTLLAAAGMIAAIYHTVKRATLAALREHDATRRP